MRAAYLLIGILVVNASLCAAADAESETSVLPLETVEFDGQVMPLAWQNDKDGESIREYIPRDETLEHWTHLASIREYPSLNDPTQLGLALVETLKQRDPETPHAIVRNEETGDVVVDFVVWPEEESEGDTQFVEFNVFKYSVRPEGGVVAQQYAVRAYDDAVEFLQNLGPLRERVVKEMAEDGLTLSSAADKDSAEDEESETESEKDSDDDSETDNAETDENEKEEGEKDNEGDDHSDE